MGHPLCDSVIEWNVLPNPVCYGLGSILCELKMLAQGLGFCEGVTRGRSEVGLGVVGLSLAIREYRAK